MLGHNDGVVLNGLLVVADDAVEVADVVVTDWIVLADRECSFVAVFGLIEFAQVFIAGSNVAVCFEVVLIADCGL